MLCLVFMTRHTTWAGGADWAACDIELVCGYVGGGYFWRWVDNFGNVAFDSFPCHTQRVTEWVRKTERHMTFNYKIDWQMTKTLPVKVRVRSVVLVFRDVVWFTDVLAWASDTVIEIKYSILINNNNNNKIVHFLWRTKLSVVYGFYPTMLPCIPDRGQTPECVRPWSAEACGCTEPVTVGTLWVGLCGKVQLQQSQIVERDHGTTWPLSVCSLSTFQLALEFQNTAQLCWLWFLMNT